MEWNSTILILLFISKDKVCNSSKKSRFIGGKLKFLVIIFGIAVSIFMHGSGLSVDNKWWWDLLLSFNVKALSENLGMAVFFFGHIFH